MIGFYVLLSLFAITFIVLFITACIPYKGDINNLPGYVDEKEEKKWLKYNQRLMIRRGDDQSYLYRHTVLGLGRWFTIKVHRILASDDECLHDHPWPFLSIILKGGYYEWTYVNKNDYDLNGEYGDIFKDNVVDWISAPDGNLIVKKWYGPGSILWRPAKWAHRLELRTATVPDELFYPIDVELPCTTLVFTFKVQRKWGFLTKFGWIWHKYYEHSEHC